MTPLYRRTFSNRPAFRHQSVSSSPASPEFGLAAPARPRSAVVVLAHRHDSDGVLAGRTGREFALKEILSPLAPFQDRMLTLQGISNRVRGDGDGYMRGMSCLLTGIELFPRQYPGRRQADPPAGPAASPMTRKSGTTSSRSQRRHPHALRLAGVRRRRVTDRADLDPHELRRPDKPIAPISDPYQMYEALRADEGPGEPRSVLDTVKGDLRAWASSSAPRTAVARGAPGPRAPDGEEIASASRAVCARAPPALGEGVADQNDNLRA